MRWFCRPCAGFVGHALVLRPPPVVYLPGLAGHSWRLQRQPAFSATCLRAPQPGPVAWNTI
eukprot:5813456-Alexandrium_andersonii.AAC.1